MKTGTRVRIIGRCYETVSRKRIPEGSLGTLGEDHQHGNGWWWVHLDLGLIEWIPKKAIRPLRNLELLADCA